jgi:tetratricopeptide (TPR) repeat protein/DNA-binding MarR family transcriptional regulator
MERLVISQNERLMLSLLELDRYRDSAEVPMSLSQEGIAKGLRTQVHNVSRALSSLEADGLVVDRLAHVRGAPRRRRAYFLTDKGRRTAESIRESVLREATAWEQDGEVEKISIAEAIKRVSLASGRAPSIIEAVDLAREGKPMTPSSFMGGSESPERPLAVTASLGRPRVGQFFGRSETLARISEALGGDAISTILVHGMPGIGKSTLLSKVFDDLSGVRPLFWHSLSPWDSDRAFADRFASFLSSCGRRSTSRALRSDASVADLYSPILSDVKGLNVVIFLDDVHKASEKLELLISMLIDAARMSRSTKLVLISRTAPAFVPKDIRQSLHIELPELDRESARQLAASSSREVGEDVLRWARGNPLLLTLISKKGGAAERRDVIGFIDSEIYSALTNGQRDVLELLSVFRHPVPLNALSQEDHEEVLALRGMSLVSERESGVWVHDLLRDYFSSRLNADRKTRAHAKAAVYCASRPEPEWKLETLFHLTEAEGWEDAAEFVVTNSESLSKDFPEETLDLIVRVSEEALGEEVLPQVLYARATLAEVVGDYTAALSDYQRSSALMSDDDPLRPLALEAFARMQAEGEHWAKSIEAHEEARSLYEEANDSEGQVREWLNLGILFKRRGDVEGARGSFTKALSIAARTENRSAQAACMNNLALLNWESGAPGDAERMFRESVRLSHAAGDHMGEGRALENFSHFCRSYVRMDEAANLLTEAASAYARAGDTVESKRARAAYAEVLADQERLADAISTCKSALADPSLSRRRGLFQERASRDAGDHALILTLTTLLRLSGEYGEARDELNKLIEDADSSGDSSLLAKGKLEAAMIAESAGDLELSSSLLSDAEKLLLGEVDREGLIAVYLRLGIVSEKMGAVDVAAKHYESAIRQAELAGNAKALTIAMESRESLSDQS